MQPKMTLKQAVEINLNYIKHIARVVFYAMLFIITLMAIKIVFILSTALGVRWLNWVWILLIIAGIIYAITRWRNRRIYQLGKLARLCKSVFDRLLALIGLVETLPIFLLVAILLKIHRQPVFFRQKRIGQYGKVFEIYKFTTVFGPKKNISTEVINPRITLLGRVLRRSTINELPQLLNVLKGEMSFIGPHVLTRKEMELYPPDVQEKIVTVKPGIIGFAALEFIEEAISVDQIDNFEAYHTKRGRLECYYIDHWSLLLDFKTLWKTVVIFWAKIQLFSIDPKFESDLETCNISEELKQEFENQGILLSNVAIPIRETGSKWLIIDENNEQAFSVRKWENELYIYRT